jgi:hypothetical protein
VRIQSYEANLVVLALGPCAERVPGNGVVATEDNSQVRFIGRSEYLLEVFFRDLISVVDIPQVPNTATALKVGVVFIGPG